MYVVFLNPIIFSITPSEYKIIILYYSMNMLNQLKNNKPMNIDYCSLERLHRIFHYKKNHTNSIIYIEDTYYIYNNLLVVVTPSLRPTER